MGNFQNKEDINLANELDYIAANYIINNNEGLDLTKDTECNAMVEKVTTFLEKSLNGLQSNYILKTRIQPREENEVIKCNTMSTIAIFYVQIANIFAAITSSVYKPKEAVKEEEAVNEEVINKEVINQSPEIKVEQIQGQRQAPIEKPSIGGSSKYFGEPYNFCSERLKNLINGQNYDKSIEKHKADPNSEMIINPNVCKKNKENEINNLALEPGITALHTLYYDIYDIKKGEFNAMSEPMKKLYKKDVQLFYKIFYGENASLPDNILLFSDISLNDYITDNSGCDVNGIYNTPYKGTLSDTLFKSYATHIKEMELRTLKNQNKLLKVFDELFTMKKDASGNNLITLHPDLNDRKLQRLTQTTRELIIQLFTTCEKDYKDGLQIYQKIVDNKLQNFIPIQKKKINEQINELMFGYFIGGNTNQKSHHKYKDKPRKIAYDFDGVIHSYVGSTDRNGQCSSLGNTISQIVKHPFMKILAKIKENHKLGHEQFIVSARNDIEFIITVLRNFQITPEMIPNKNVFTAWSEMKWKTLGEKEINEFYDDSCIVIVNIQKYRNKPILKHLDKLFLVFPENKKWLEIHKNNSMDLHSCMQIKII